MSDIGERTSPRFAIDTTVFIELEAAAFDQKSEADIHICRCLDLSSTGVQVELDRAIPEGNIHRLCLDVRGRAPIIVVVRVQWQRRNEETGQYHAGFMLLESKGTDFDLWQHAITQMFE